MKNTFKKQKFTILIAVLIGLFATTNLFSQEADSFSKVRDNDIEAVKAMIEAGADVNYEYWGKTALGLAVTDHNPEMVKMLLSKGANINHRDESTGYTHLMMALNSSQIEMAKLLVSEGADINLKSNGGVTALILAAGNSKELVELFLANGADINARTETNLGVFTQYVMGIISERVSIDLAELLLKKGADVDEENSHIFATGETPLFMAAGEDNEELIKFLIKNGANVNTKSKEGKTPLSIAVEEGHTKIIELLKSNGAK